MRLPIVYVPRPRLLEGAMLEGLLVTLDLVTGKPSAILCVHMRSDGYRHGHVCKGHMHT